MGPWHLVWLTVVSGVPSLSSDYPSSEGALLHCSTLCYVGSRLVRPASPVPFRQHRCHYTCHCLHVSDSIVCPHAQMLSLFQSLYECHLRTICIHIPVGYNSFADLPSRNNTSLFLHCMSHACHSTTQMPPDLCSLLYQHTPNWALLQRRELFSSF